MNPMKSLLAVITCAGALAGCVDATSPAAPGNDVEAGARNACVAAVKSFTGNSDVSVISSDFSEAGTKVTLQVGPTGTWQCMGYTDGSTGEIMSLTDEGAL